MYYLVFVACWAMIMLIVHQFLKIQNLQGEMERLKSEVKHYKSLADHRRFTSSNDFMLDRNDLDEMLLYK
jgi:hypothetical protein